MIKNQFNLALVFSILLISSITIDAQTNKATGSQLFSSMQQGANDAWNTGGAFKMQNTEYGNPPEWNWVKTIGGSATDRATAIVNDAEGNLYVAGSFSGTTDFDGIELTSDGYIDGFLAKYDSDGNLLWVEKIANGNYKGIQALKVIVDDNDNIFVGGTDLGAGGTDPSGLVQELFITKFNTEGVQQWFRTDGATAGAYYCYGLGINSSGHIFVIVDNDRMNIYDSEMNLLSTKLYNGDMSDLLVKADKLYLAGSFDLEMQLGGLTLVGSTKEAFIAKADVTSSIPSFEWLKGSNSDNSQGFETKAYTLALDNLENVYLGGYFIGNTTFDLEQNDNLQNPYTKQSFLVQYNWNGEYQWSLQSDTDFGPSIAGGNEMNIATDENGYVFFAAAGANLVQVGSAWETVHAGYVIQANVFGDVWGTVDTEQLFNDMISTADGYVFEVGTWDFNFIVRKSFQADEEEWTVRGDSDAGYASATRAKLAMDNENNIYFMPRVIGKVAVDGAEGIDLDNFSGLVVKMDAAGNHLWTYTFVCGGTVEPKEISYSADGHIIVIGDFDGILSTGQELFNSEDGKVFMSKISLTGNVIWMRQFKDEAMDVNTDKDGNIYLSTTFANDFDLGVTDFTSYGSDDICIAKLNPSGETLWAKQIGGAFFEYLAYVDVDGEGNVYVSGETVSDVLFYETSSIVYDTDPTHVFFAKYNTDGDLQWMKTIGEDAEDVQGDTWPYATKTDDDGNTYMIGWHSAESTFGDFTLTGDYFYNIFITKFNSDGEVLWAKSISNTQYDFHAYQLDLDEQGNVYIGGRFRDAISFGNDYEDVVPEGRRDLYFAKYTTDGELDWVKTHKGANGVDVVWVGGMAVYKEDQLFYVGHFLNDMDFGNAGTLHAANQTVYIAQMGTDVPTAINNDATALVNTLQLQPNPTNKTTIINYELSIPSKVQIQVFNLEGKLLQNIALGQQTIGPQMYQLNTKTLPTGMYLIQINSQGKTQTAKLEVVR